MEKPIMDKDDFKKDIKHFHLLIGVTGSVAAIKLRELIEEIKKLR